MSEIEMSMDERWIPLMRMGFKTCTTRLNRKGFAGDFFIIDGMRFMLTMVRRVPLSVAVHSYYLVEGFDTPHEMAEALRSYYPDLKDEDMVWCHHFVAIERWEQ